MEFAADKGYVVARDQVKLKMENVTLPQVNETKYLGIPFSARGPNWKSHAESVTKKAKNAIMLLMSVGYNQHTWDASSKVNVYKLFIRPFINGIWNASQLLQKRTN